MKTRQTVVFLFSISILCYAFAMQQPPHTVLESTRIDFPPTNVQGDIVIQSEKAYQKLLKNSDYSPGSTYPAPPEIDFSTHFLIGYKHAHSGCGIPQLRQRVTQSNDSVWIHIAITEFGLCEPLRYTELWCVVTKSTPFTTLVFEERKTIAPLTSDSTTQRYMGQTKTRVWQP